MYDHLSLAENLDFFAAMYELPVSDARARAEELSERLGLAGRQRHKLGSLSTGLKKRAQLARALLHRPAILFLDEPTAGLDAEAALEVSSLIRQLARGEQVTVFLCTHNLFLAERICDSFAFLRRGELAARGAKQELVRAEPGQRRVRITTLRGQHILPYVEPADIDGLVRGLQARDERIVEVRLLEPTLEEVYLRYVGRRHERA
jgi:ABC-2 type transport system ATP-binding protein